jgi:MraZ protein
MISGESEHTIDDKGRVAIPSKFREAIGGSLILTLGFEGCLIAYTPERFRQLTEELNKLPYLRAETRSLQRLMMHGAELVEIDRQGRVLIPQMHREHAGIHKDVVVIGMIDKLEIWAKERWLQFLEQVKPNYETIAQNFENIRL